MGRGKLTDEEREVHRKAALKVWEERRAGLRPYDTWNRSVAAKLKWARFRVMWDALKALDER